MRQFLRGAWDGVQIGLLLSAAIAGVGASLILLAQMARLFLGVELPSW